MTQKNSINVSDLKNLCNRVLTMLVLSGLLTFSNAAKAKSVEGRWITTEGEAVDVLGNKTKCVKIELVVSEGPGELITEKYSADCGVVFSNWGPNRMQIENGKVFESGIETGTFKNNELITRRAKGGVIYTFNYKLNLGSESDQDMLENFYSVKNFIGTMSIRGNLKRVEN